MGQTQAITRDSNFWYVKSHGDEAERFDITKKEDLTRWVDAEGGHIRSRMQTDANTGHLFYVDEERSGFLFVPHGDFDKICFISLYVPGNKSIGFAGEKLTRAARVYITMYTSMKNSVIKAKTTRLQNHIKHKLGVTDLSEEKTNEIMNILDRYSQGMDLTKDELTTIYETYYDNDLDALDVDDEENFNEKVFKAIEKLSSVIKTHSIVINPWLNSVRMYSRGDGPRKLHTGYKLDIDKEVWNAAFNWISPSSGQQPQGEKAFSDSSINAHAAVGRNMMGGSSS